MRRRLTDTRRAPNAVDQLWPVGSVFMAAVSTDPSALLGFGTWQRIGKGRAIVGVDEADADFDAAEKTGGAKTHTLTSGEMPVHTHTVTDPGHSHLTQRYPTATGALSGFTIDVSMSGTLADNTLPTKAATTGITNQDTGGGGAHNNLQPFCCLYIWRRIA